MSIAKKIEESGLQSAQVRKYLTEVSSSTSSAPIRRQSGSAAKNITAPIMTDVMNIIITEQENTLFAVSLSFLPSAIEIGTDAPTPIRSAREKLIITSGIAIFTAANAPSPSKFQIIGGIIILS